MARCGLLWCYDQEDSDLAAHWTTQQKVQGVNVSERG